MNSEGNPVASKVHTGLLALQHRGQDSAGIAAFDGSRINLKKGLGLVSQVFTEENLDVLHGNAAIGHVRYSTSGSTTKENAHPFILSVPITLATAFNGNIVNYEELSKKYDGHMETNCDIEVLMKVFVEEYGKTHGEGAEGVFKAVKKVFEKVNGAYSVVNILDTGLLAYRDPRAIRPLAMGRSKDGKTIAFASESVAFDALGMEFVKDVGAGEAVFVDFKGKVHEKIIDAKPVAHCMFEYVYFSRPDSELDGKNVYGARINLGRILGEKLKGKGDVVVAVPDTSRPAAQALGESAGIPNQEGLIKNRYVWRTFIMPTQKQRDKAIEIKLNVNKSVVEGKRVILVDDSIVRGTTSRKIVKLVKAKAKTVHFISTCPPLKNPCYYGIDFPDEQELIAHSKTIPEIRDEIGADELTYSSVDDIRQAIGLPLCTACITGEYPAPVTEEYKRHLREARREEREKHH